MKRQTLTLLIVLAGLWPQQPPVATAQTPRETGERRMPASCLSQLALAAAAAAAALPSGLGIGSEAPAFDPQHVWGPDKGSHACPMCKYGFLQGVLLWVNTDELEDAGRIASRLEREIRERDPKRLRAFVIYTNPGGKPIREVEDLLTSLARKASLQLVAVTYVPSPIDPKTSALYRINPDPRVRNTVFVYRKRRVVDKFVNLGADEASLQKLADSMGRTLEAR
jgi:protocatechuate 3,4-dioxygenase beta subunit